jgi:hypothetical protein
MLPVSLDCVVFLFCFSSFGVPYVASFSGLCCVFDPEKLATYGTPNEEKQNKNTTQSRETGNIGYTRRRETKQKHNTIQRKLGFCFVSLLLVYPMLPVSLDCVVFLFCFSSSCVPYVASFSGLCCVNPEELAT